MWSFQHLETSKPDITTMSNETIISTVYPRASEADGGLFGYIEVNESSIVYYGIEVLIYVISIITNAITVTLLCCHRRLRILSNLFFGCLAVSDLVQGFFGVAFNALRIFGLMSGGDWSFVKVEGRMFLLVGWWLSTLFSYGGILLITLERWLFIAYPFLHQRLYRAKYMFGAVAIVIGLCSVACAAFTTGDTQSANVGISFPVLHTAYSILIVSTYAHIVVISYRQQKSIRAMTNGTALNIALSHKDEVNRVESNAYHNESTNGNAVRNGSRKEVIDKVCSAGGNKEDSSNSAFIFTVESQTRNKHDPGQDAKDHASLSKAQDNSAYHLSPNCTSKDNHIPSDTNIGRTSGDHALGVTADSETNFNGTEKTVERKRKRELIRGKNVKQKAAKIKGRVTNNWKAVKMSATVFSMYFCFMSPWIYYEFASFLLCGQNRITTETSQALNTLTCLHFCSNFFVYSFQNRDFRKVLGNSCARLFSCCFPSLKTRISDMRHVTVPY